MFQGSQKAIIQANALPLRTAATVRSVCFDARVLLNIVQSEAICLHVDEGYIFGVMIDDILEVTNNISLPPERVQEYESEQARETAHQQFLVERNKYQQACAESLRRLNMDSEVVGWYTSSFPDGITAKSTVDTQFLSQSEMPNFVMVSYDPFASMSGTLHLRVLRLTPKYMQFHSAGDFTQAGVMMSGLVGEDIYEEVPYTVHVPLLASVFLYETDFAKNDLPRDGNAVMMERDASAYMKRNLGDAANALDSLARDVAECTGKPMRRKSKETQEEARYNSLLTSRGLPVTLANIADVGAQYSQGALFASILANDRVA